VLPKLFLERVYLVVVPFELACDERAADHDNDEEQEAAHDEHPREHTDLPQTVLELIERCIERVAGGDERHAL
jgi:hypothetical protein